jgi:hypothetical protein
LHGRIIPDREQPEQVIPRGRTRASEFLASRWPPMLVTRGSTHGPNLKASLPSTSAMTSSL